MNADKFRSSSLGPCRVGAIGLLLGLAGMAAAGELRIATEAATVTVFDGERALLVYQRTPNPYKVYVSQWSTPAGLAVLRDSPHDHVHHHALMYAIGAEGVDFWGEDPKQRPGKQVPIHCETATEGNGQAVRACIRQQVDWQDAGGQSLLAEDRRLTLAPAAIAGASLLTWDSTFRPAGGKPRVQLWGRHYFGLGLRFVVPMDKDGSFLYAGQAPGEGVRGTERLTRTDWCAYTAAIDGRPVTVAVFGHPENARHPTSWFTMTQPFAYLAATLDLAKEPLELPAEAPLQLRYGLTLWDGKVELPAIQAGYEAWLKSLEPASEKAAP